jgi:hypothetical protein
MALFTRLPLKAVACFFFVPSCCVFVATDAAGYQGAGESSHQLFTRLPLKAGLGVWSFSTSTLNAPDSHLT